MTKRCFPNHGAVYCARCTRGSCCRGLSNLVMWNFRTDQSNVHFGILTGEYTDQQNESALLGMIRNRSI